MTDRWLQEIVDRAQIADVISRYAFMMDNGEMEQIVDELFTDDVVDDHGAALGGELRGRDAVRETFRAGAEALEATQHHLGTQHIEISGDVARCFTYTQGWHWLRSTSHLGPNRPADFLNIGAYLHELRRTGDSWRICRQSAHLFGPGTTGVAVGALPPEWEAGFADEPRLAHAYGSGRWRVPFTDDTDVSQRATTAMERG